MCTCEIGYEGSNCQFECSNGKCNTPCTQTDIQCQNGGDIKGYSDSNDEMLLCGCDCSKVPFSGKLCEIPDNPVCIAALDGNACENNGIAVGYEPYCQCRCKPGFSGENCEIIGECTLKIAQCKNHGHPIGLANNCSC